MKKFIFVFVLLLISVRFYAQAPEKVNYQAVARNLAGAPLINQTINVKYEIRQGSTTGVVVYAENHVLTTNQFGLFTAEIGGGTVITGSFPGIAWGTSPFYLFVEVDGDPMGVTQLLSVPYALYAKESGNGPAGLPGKNSLSVSSAYSGPMCSANGGSQIDVGLDDNNDGILQPIEIDFTYYVCNGIDGVIGSNGLNTLSSTVASTSCANGGVTVNMGLDANNNNILEASEISVSYDVCNGTDGLPGTNGTDGLNILAETIPSTSCPNGGVTVNMGQDINNNGILETGEITTTYDVCNGVDGTSGTTYFAGNGISLSGDTITNIGDADADPTNELQNLSISNDTLYISGGNQVIIPSLTETTTTLIDNGNGTFTYTDETGTPITFDANIDDADADATNELQVLSFSNDTLYLSNGNSVYITPSAADNWGSDFVNTSGTNISGDGTAGNPLTVTETTSSLVDNADGTFTYTDETGTPITFDANIDDADADATNELELPMIGNTPGDVLIWNGSSWVAGTDQTADGDTDPNNELELPTIGNTPGDVLVWNGTNWVAGTDQTADGDTDPNNEIELPLSASPGEVLMWNGSNWAAGTDQTADGDTDSNNEIQDISLAGTNLSITSGSTVDLSTITGTDSQDLDLSGNTLSLTNDATPVDLSPYLDNTDNQTLSISNDTLFLTNGGSVVLPSKDSTNIYNSDGTLTGARTVTQNANNITYIGGGINPTAIFRNGNALGSKIQIDATNAGASPSVNLTNNGTNWGGISGTANGLQLSGGTGGNVGIGVSPANGRFVVQHAATAAYPSIKLNQTDLNLNRIHFTNTPVANKYWEIAAETDANNANSGYSINYFNGSTYNIHFLTYGNGKTAINGSGFVPGPNYSMFDVFGSSTIRDSLSIRTSHGSGYTFPVVDGSANYIMKTDGAGNLSWMDPSSLGGNAWSLTGNAGTNSSTNFIGTTDAQDLKFRTNNTEKMVITQSGDVGIGTTSPGSLLHLRKNNTLSFM
ncbi:MAG: hypothetical protein HS119_09545 [Flavobacteriales bacterium]|nr:hypothetical protein [Flavobacteriales bacterium]